MGGEDVVLVDEETGKQFPMKSKDLKLPPGSSSSPTLPYVPQRSDRADLIDKIKPDLIVETIRNMLMGKDLKDGIWIENQNEDIKKNALSEKGARDIATLILSVSNQNTAISKLDDTVIRRRTLGILRSAHELIIKNWKEYNITGIDQISYYHNIIFSLVFIILKQPEGEGIRKLIAGTISENRNVGADTSGGIGSMFSKLLGGGGRR